MIKTKISESKLTARQHDYSIEIMLEDERTVVRKFEVIAGIRVPVDETYALDLPTAQMVVAWWTITIIGYSLN